MGKFQSKHAAAASKRRESPEGDSVVVSAFASGRKGTEEVERHGGGVEHRARDKQELPSGDPKEGLSREDQCPLEVVLPPEKAEGLEGPGQLFSADDGERAAHREAPRGLGRKRLDIDALQCDVSVEEDNRQEWTFTLYGFDNSGKATREDMSSLMHTIYEVVDASVNHSSGSSKTLRVKLTVSPEPSGKRKEGPPAGQDREPARCGMEGELTEDSRVADKRLSAHIRRPSADPHPCPVRGSYCVDENTERRNHYLDLAGIENYTSRFGPGPPGRPPPPAAPATVLRPQAVPAEGQGRPLAAQGDVGPARGSGARGGEGPAARAGGRGLRGARGPAPRTPPPPRAPPPPPLPPPRPVLARPQPHTTRTRRSRPCLGSSPPAAADAASRSTHLMPLTFPGLQSYFV
ncbi:protein naked cuticle homolog 2 isoform X10 [Equus asinus]|uniref:protein naked cuticle homolog 2 isoform X10 n=1 Tax=Equus asinus TaxID=9793 RepID=UPI0038F7F622